MPQSENHTIVENEIPLTLTILVSELVKGESEIGPSPLCCFLSLLLITKIGPYCSLHIPLVMGMKATLKV